MGKSAIAILSVTLLTVFFFLAFTIIGLFTGEETQVGFPLWFWKQSCSISINPETGETTGSTFAINYFHLVLDVGVALLPAYFVTTKTAMRKNTNKKE